MEIGKLKRGIEIKIRKGGKTATVGRVKKTALPELVEVRGVLVSLDTYLVELHYSHNRWQDRKFNTQQIEKFEVVK